MKKVAIYSLFALFLSSFSSCFLFQSHEDCPAYGELEKQKTEKTDLNQIETTEEV